MSDATTQSVTDVLSEHVIHEMDHWLAKYPADQRQSAVLGALRALQHEDGFLDTKKMDAVAKYIGMPAIAVYEVGSFYSMFSLKPTAKHEVAVCTNISCMLRGAEDIVEHLEKKYQIKLGESTPDGKIYLKKEEECLAGCCGAPMMQLNHKYYENLTIKKIDEILDNLE